MITLVLTGLNEGIQGHRQLSYVPECAFYSIRGEIGSRLSLCPVGAVELMSE